MKTLKVLFACALGATIGILVAFSINHYFWWVGMIAGFAVGYLSYEFKTVLKTAPIAWDFASLRFETFAESMRPDPVNWRLRLKFIGCAVIVLLSAVLGLRRAGDLLLQHQIYVHSSLYHNALALTPLVICFISFGAGVFLTVGALCMLFTQNHEELKKHTTGAWKIALSTNPISLLLSPVWVPCWIGYTIWKHRKVIGKWIAEASGFCWTFLKNAYFHIYSDTRLLCGSSAAVGVLIGYGIHSILLGVAVAGTFGLANYRIIKKFPRPIQVSKT